MINQGPPVNCTSCSYHHSDGAGGWCTRYPVWAAVKRDHFCGEYKAVVAQDVVPPGLRTPVSAPKKPISPTRKPRKKGTVKVPDLGGIDTEF